MHVFELNDAGGNVDNDAGDGKNDAGGNDIDFCNALGGNETARALQATATVVQHFRQN